MSVSNDPEEFTRYHKNGSVPTATLLVGYTNQDDTSLTHFQTLADRLADQLKQPVIPCPLDGQGNPMLDGIGAGLQQGSVKFVVLPLILSPAEYRESAIAAAIEWASRRWSFLSFHVSPPLDWRGWIGVFSSLVTDTGAALSQTGVVLIAPQADAADLSIEVIGDLAKVARLFQETQKLPRVELTVGQSSQDVESAVHHCMQAGVDQVVVVPTFPFENDAYTKIQTVVNQLNDTALIPIALARPLSDAVPMVKALFSLHEEALADDSLLPVSWDEVRRQVEASNADHRPAKNGLDGIPADEAQFQDLTQRINAILPPRYQQAGTIESTVSAAPMASADLQFDAHGQVAWDQMWGLDDPDSPFCELALAGGPPHRGDLLEPVAARECEASPSKYSAVLAELERGINLVAGLPTFDSASLGWIGVQCESPEMAIWLLRAIIVENVMVRREDDVLYLPAGPEFALAGEIKNVVTVVAKTVHYWKEHSLAMSIISKDR